MADSQFADLQNMPGLLQEARGLARDLAPTTGECGSRLVAAF
jgi:hypothetical protein